MSFHHFHLFLTLIRASRIIKFANSSVIAPLLDDQGSDYGSVMKDFIGWYWCSFLKPNVSETEEMLIDKVLFASPNPPFYHNCVLLGDILQYIATQKGTDLHLSPFVSDSLII